jgi:tetratricopeptide (TPR) repeat protein
MIAFISFASSVVTLLAVLPSRHTSSPRLTGDFNIVVAKFAGLDEGGRAVESVEATDLAHSMYTRLEAGLRDLARADEDLQVQAPDAAGLIKGTTAGDRADAVAKLARRANADLVVFGTMAVGNGQTVFSPEFYLDGRKLANAEELSLAGHHDLGSPLTQRGEIDRNVDARAALRRQLLGRTQALTQFVIGLSAFSRDDFSRALEYFGKAEAAEGWSDREGKEVLYLFKGNAALKLGDMASAEAAYARALAVNPDYARAQIGAAEVTFHRARGQCEAGATDHAGLERALAVFRQAGAATYQPPLADIPVKASFGAARVLLCQGQSSDANRLVDAVREFETVTAAFDSGDEAAQERLRQMAAEAHAGLGFAALPTADDTPSLAAAGFRRALASYQRAVDLGVRPERLAFFHSMLGYIHGRLDAVADADREYDKAIALEPDPAQRSTYENAQRSLHAGRP